MRISDSPSPGGFCWLDLAATDAAQARQFYAEAFDWQAIDQAANGGHFTRLRHGAADTGSLYQLSPAQLQGRVPSHWTPYIAVADMTDTLRRVAQAGGRVIVQPVAIDGVTVVALIEDAVGALVGLWQARSLSENPTPKPAQEPSVTSELNKKLMQDIFAEIAEGKGTLFAAALADNVVMRVTGQYSWSRTFVGKQAVLRDLYGYVRSRVEKGSRTQAFNFVAEGDHVIVEARGDMTTKTGAKYDNEYCLIYRLEDGKIVEMREYCDSQLCEQRLGPFPSSQPQLGAL